MIKAVQLFSLVMIVFIFSQNGEGKKDEAVDTLAVEEKKSAPFLQIVFIRQEFN